MVRMDQAHADHDLADQDRMGRKPEMDPKGQPGPEAGGHAGHAEPEPAESHEGAMSGPDRSSDTGSAHDAGPKAGEPARKATAGFDPDCFASMFVRQVRQCFSAVWADGFPRCRHRFPVM